MYPLPPDGGCDAEPTAMSAALWDGVDRLIDTTPELDRLRAHGLHLLAGRRWRATGRPVPAELLAEERAAALAVLCAPAVLTRARVALEGPMVVLKGPVAAARYPDPALRPFGDLDLLVTDPEGAHRTLMAAGFTEAAEPDFYAGRPDFYHRSPLACPGFPLPIELHRRPKWPHRMTPPAARELLEAARPAPGLDGLLELPPAHHALVLAAHGWAHSPLEKVRDLVDVMALAELADPAELAGLARRWSLQKVLAATMAAAEALILGRRRRPLALRTWARSLAEVRPRRRSEYGVARAVGALWELPPREAVLTAARGARARLRGGPSAQR